LRIAKMAFCMRHCVNGWSHERPAAWSSCSICFNIATCSCVSGSLQMIWHLKWNLFFIILIFFCVSPIKLLRIGIVLWKTLSECKIWKNDENLLVEKGLLVIVHTTSPDYFIFPFQITLFLLKSQHDTMSCKLNWDVESMFSLLLRFENNNHEIVVMLLWLDLHSGNYVFRIKIKSICTGEIDNNPPGNSFFILILLSLVM
jgi:hypothetical protein